MRKHSEIIKRRKAHGKEVGRIAGNYLADGVESLGGFFFWMSAALIELYFIVRFPVLLAVTAVLVGALVFEISKAIISIGFFWTIGIFGTILGTLLAIFVTPVLNEVFEKKAAKRKAARRRRKNTTSQHPNNVYNFERRIS